LGGIERFDGGRIPPNAVNSSEVGKVAIHHKVRHTQSRFDAKDNA
jgi:hypothetical protein